jgi:hypothetical protein
MGGVIQAITAWFDTSKISDEEFIERLRGTMATWDRLRRRLRVFYLLLAVAVVGLVVAVCLLLTNLMGRGIQGQNLGFALGFILGLFLGGLTFKVGFGLMDSLSCGYRSERLLIRYYDAIRQFSPKATAIRQESENP